MDDEAVIATNDDASECKRNAVHLGYWKDEYIAHLIKVSQRRAPEINRGYYARVKGVERFIKKFLREIQGGGGNGGNGGGVGGGSSGGGNGDEEELVKAQIINLGAGFDTLYWRLRDDGYKMINYIDIDYPTVTSRKCYLIKRSKQLLQRIHDQDDEVKLSATDMHAGNYHCLGLDLRNLSELEMKLQQSECDYSLPTLFIAECVLVYIENDCVDRLMKMLAQKFHQAMFINYEMCNMNDTFGDVMLENIRARGCSLNGIAHCKNMETQHARFTLNGWNGARGWDMVQIYYGLPNGEREKIEKIEFLDEQELLIQLFQHYCICIGWLGERFANLTYEDD